MPCFLSDTERAAVLDACRHGDPLVHRFRTALTGRVRRRACSPGLLGGQEDAAWWYPAAEYLGDAAMAFALEPGAEVGAWLRQAALGIVRRSEADWVGPWYRDHHPKPAVGHLETAHLCWGLGVALDLAAGVFSAPERDEIVQVLQERGIPLCCRWLERNRHLANWRAVMTAGVAVAAAATGDNRSLRLAARETRVCAEAFQADGSYAESLQYGNYLLIALMMAFEAIHRTASRLEPAGPEVAARCMPWFATCMLYHKPLPGWGAEPRPRAVNFNDSAATFRPSGDVLLQVAARCRQTMPREAGLARWLFDTCYAAVPDQGPHHLASFGLRNDWGFLTIPFLIEAAPALAPEEAGLPPCAGFDNGNVIARDAWQGRTVLAVQGGSQPLCAPGHLHGDLNSFVLTHRCERLLVDPGHSCYRNLIHGLESASQTHNTCTFLVRSDPLGLQEDLAKAELLEQQSVVGRRPIVGERAGAPVPSRGRRLLLERIGQATAIGSEAGAAYGAPIEEFARFWLLLGSSVLFVVDRIRAARPVTTVWNWLLNNRDGKLEAQAGAPQAVLAQRPLAGLKLFHLGPGRLAGPVYAFVHDAYHPEPGRPGEGHSGTGLLYRWIEPSAETFRLAVHAMTMDDAGLVDRWLIDSDGQCHRVHRDGREASLQIVSAEPLELVLRSSPGAGPWRLRESEAGFSFQRSAE